MASKFSELTPIARAIWAKSGYAGGHGLLAHMLDVAAVAETLLEYEPRSTVDHFSRLFGLEASSFACCVAAMVGLHDFGKAIPGFQMKWPEGRHADEARGLPFPATACNLSDHPLATAALLGQGLVPLTTGEVVWVRHVLQAISAHHGYHFSASEVNEGQPLYEPREWREARQEILATYWRVVAPEIAPILDELGMPAVNWLAGLTSTADWIGSNVEWFPQGERYDDLRDYYRNSCGLAAEALRQIGWSRARSLLQAPADTATLLGRVAGRDEMSARPLQEVGDRLLLGAQGPALLLVEAPMGEGKTELAFLAHLRLQAANGHRGCYLALPTQATGNAMFQRALTFLQNFVQEHTDVQLVHGGAVMNESMRHLRDINHSKGESLSASAWFSQRRRPLLSPYGIGTIDQALYAVLNVKHHFVRLWGLSNRVVVLDEVHAYDTYTHGLIAVFLKWLKALGCSVVLMSATLPRARRRELIEAWGLADEKTPELAYPRLLLADENGVKGESFAARRLAPIHIAGLGEGLDLLAEKALELLAAGGCGAIIVNTVDRAQELYAILREKMCESMQLLLFHARFPADDRAERERQVLALFGAVGTRPRCALLIATQVVEQSLDIDFDFMISDLAPVDLLLQRAGRLHRHPRPRVLAHTEPRLWVAGLLHERPPELEETAWGFVYDSYILGRTWALLVREETLHLPVDIDRLVQAVYDIDTPLPDDLEDEARSFIEIESYGAYRARVNKERQESVSITIDPLHEPQSAYAGKPRGSEEGEGQGLENRTRLGPEAIVLVPVEVVGGEWCVREGEPPFSPDRLVDDTTARKLYGRQLKVSRATVVKHFKANPVARAFAEHSLLKYFYPLPMSQGRFEAGAMQLRLDGELGLVIEG